MTAVLSLHEPEPPDYDAGDVPPALGRLLGVRLAAAVLHAFGNVRNVARASDVELRAMGMNQQRIAAFRAAVEIGALAVAAPVLGKQIIEPSDVVEYFAAKVGLADVEEAWLLGLNARHVVVGEAMLARGSVTSVEISPRSVFRALLRMDAVDGILVHGHPSGDPTPSTFDVEVTIKLMAAGEVVGVGLIDHLVVVAGPRWRSCRR